MKATIKPIQIKLDERNRVTSSRLFKKRCAIDQETGRVLFCDEGIFSEKIFGKFGSCWCGKRTKEGYCEECGCRVLNKHHMPQFYIELSMDIPNRSIQFDDKDKETIMALLTYKAFLFRGQLYYFDHFFDYKKDEWPEDEILIGKDALLSLGLTEEWYNANVHRIVPIPHTSFRKIKVRQNGGIPRKRLGKINTTYIDVLKACEKFEEFKESAEWSVFGELNLRQNICECMNKVYSNFFNMIALQKKSIIALELKGQPETGHIRAVLTNNFSLNEDVVVIGYHFIRTLYPMLYHKYSNGGTGPLDIKGLNKELREGEYKVLVNRQPTIGAKSVIAMYPVFSEKENERFVVQANPIVYDGLAADVDGDVINVLSLYTVAANNDAQKLLPSHNFLEGSNSSIRNGILEEFAYVEKKLEEQKEDSDG